MEIIYKLKTEYHKIQLLLILIFLVVLPFNAILQTFFNYKLGVSFFSYFKELLLIFILLINLICITELNLKFKTWSNNLSTVSNNNRALIYLTVTYLTWICLSIFWRDSYSFSNFIYGFKFDGFMFLCLLTGLTLPNKTKINFNKIIQFYFYSLLTALTIGLFLHFIINPENLTWLGFRNDWSTFYSDQALAFCQRIENNTTCRFQGTFSGPNQAGANILLGLAVFLSLITVEKFKKYQLVAIFSIILISLFFTFSRSSWIALLVFGMLVIMLEHKAKLLKMFGIFLVSVLAALILVMSFVPEVVLRYESNSERVELFVSGLNEVFNAPILGQGIGIAGPASHYSLNPLITENWFLQVVINYGTIGLILFGFIYLEITKKLFRRKEVYFLVLMIALLVPLNLLHYFEDSSFVYSLFLLIGLLISRE
jgi:O-antigen ligase